VAYDRVNYLSAVKRIPDKLWDGIRLILPPEKPNNTIGRPPVPFRKISYNTNNIIIINHEQRILNVVF
jgi:hypothetical protein